MELEIKVSIKFEGQAKNGFTYQSTCSLSDEALQYVEPAVLGEMIRHAYSEFQKLLDRE